MEDHFLGGLNLGTFGIGLGLATCGPGLGVANIFLFSSLRITLFSELSPSTR